MADNTIRACLVVIAASLAVIALRSVIEPAWAADTVRCEVSGPLTIRSIDDKIQVEVSSAYSAPGSSSSSPVHVKMIP